MSTARNGSGIRLSALNPNIAPSIMTSPWAKWKMPVARMIIEKPMPIRP
jgi:hypothetical protein